jgi:hypothetical protein
LRIGESARKSIAFLIGLNYFLQYSKLCGENSILDKHDFHPFGRAKPRLICLR